MHYLQKNRKSYFHVIRLSIYLQILMQNYVTLAYQPVLPHGPIRINIKIRIIANNYDYLPHTLFHLLNILTHTLKYIFVRYYLVAIDFILHDTSTCVDIYLIELFVCELII